MGISAAVTAIGNVYMNRGEYEKANEHYKRSQDINEPLGNLNGVSTALNNMGNVSIRLGRYDEGLATLGRAADICESLGDQSGFATALGNIGSVHDLRGNYDTALQFLLKSLAIWESINDRWGLVVGLTDVGEAYRKLQRLADARESLVRAHALATETQLKEVAAMSLCELGLLCEAEAAQAEGDAKGAKMNDAREQLETGVAILIEMNNVQKDKYETELERVKKSLTSEV